MFFFFYVMGCCSYDRDDDILDTRRVSGACVFDDKKKFRTYFMEEDNAHNFAYRHCANPPNFYNISPDTKDKYGNTVAKILIR